jgi:D-xylose 1-dehydrogenase (NADP+, D-xylono-1,5-lactone-forming)
MTELGPSGRVEGAGARWAVLGTANIAARAFLPALRRAGGRAVVVGSRSPERATSWASEHGIDRACTYESAVQAGDVDAVYIALPNDQHALWAAAAHAAGKAVLCEKPLTLDTARTGELLRTTGPEAALWEAYVFPFHPQTTLLANVVGEGRIGTLREIISEFHFTVSQPTNIRLQHERGGGALYDVGGYPLRLARLLFGTEPVAAAGRAGFHDSEVDLDVAAILDFHGHARLVMSAGMRRPASTFTRVVGTAGELRVTNPFHPTAGDTVELWRQGQLQQTWQSAEGSAFQHALGHIHAVLRGAVEPRHRAVDDAMGQARAVDLVRQAAMTIGAR